MEAAHGATGRKIFTSFLRRNSEKQLGDKGVRPTVQPHPASIMKTDFSFKLVAAAVLAGVFLALFHSARGVETVQPANPAAVTATVPAHS